MVYYRISPEFEDGYVHKILLQELSDWSWFRKSIEVTGANGELLFLVVKCMPDQLRERIVEVIKAVYPRDWNYMAIGEVERTGFRADHFCLWNRYCENVRRFMPVSASISHYSYREQMPLVTFISPILWGYVRILGAQDVIGFPTYLKILLKTVDISIDN